MAKDDKTFSIVAEPRELTGKRSKQLRRRNLIPAVLYGQKLEPHTLQVRRRDFERTYLRAGTSALIDLSIGDGGTPHKVFIHEVQRNPLNYQLTHVDFLEVNLLEEITVNVRLVPVGESPIVRSREGLLLHQTEHITLKTLPANVPSLIEVDISGLTEVDQAIHVRDLTLPDDVTLLSNPDDLVVKITQMPLAVEEVEEAAEAEAAIETGAEVEEAETGHSETEAGEEGAS